MFLGNDIMFPYNMGRIELRKYFKVIKVVDGKIYTNLPVNWKETLKLWESDNNAYKNRVLIKYDYPELFAVIYNKRHAKFENKSFYQF